MVWIGLVHFYDAQLFVTDQQQFEVMHIQGIITLLEQHFNGLIDGFDELELTLVRPSVFVCDSLTSFAVV